VRIRLGEALNDVSVNWTRNVELEDGFVDFEARARSKLDPIGESFPKRLCAVGCGIGRQELPSGASSKR